jgi:hypothetical protein
VEVWQIALLTFFVLLPIALLLDFYPGRERVASDGQPLQREWQRQITHEPHEDDHH